MRFPGSATSNLYDDHAPSRVERPITRVHGVRPDSIDDRDAALPWVIVLSLCVSISHPRLLNRDALTLYRS